MNKELLEYLIVTLVLLVGMIAYLKLADRFNIIDKPNERSSHVYITIRGGGVIFFLAYAIFFVRHGYVYPWFFLGLSAIAVVSFLDDVKTLPSMLRLVVHLGAVVLMLVSLDLLSQPWWMLAIGFVLAVGIINAYNFMDGINGINGLYSLAVLIPLYLAERPVGLPLEAALLWDKGIPYVAISIVVFGIFNFRNKAKCFAGDVGSITMALIVVLLLYMLIFGHMDPYYLFFLVVYGVDALLTIFHRLYKRENILKAHRTHLYQYMTNVAGWPHLAVSALYALGQFLISWGLIVSLRNPKVSTLQYCVIILLFLVLAYIGLKFYFIRLEKEKASKS